MAQLFTRNLVVSNSSDARFRAWAQFIHDGFEAGGWVQTADTGQIDLTTATAPGAANNKVGYEIWRMADAAQSTLPVYVKIYYGSGSATNNPGIWLQIGPATNGSGSISGSAYYEENISGNALFYSGSNSTTEKTVSWIGSDTNRIAVAIMLSVSSGSYGFCFSIERGHTSAGAVDADVLLIAGTLVGGSTLNRIHRYHADDGSTTTRPRLNLIDRTTGAATTTNLVAAAFPIPFDPEYLPARPGWSWLVVNTGAADIGARLSVRSDGVTTRYVRLPLQTGNTGTEGGNAIGRLCIRWE